MLTLSLFASHSMVVSTLQNRKQPVPKKPFITILATICGHVRTGNSLPYVPTGFFQRGSSAMMTFLRLGFGGSGLVLAGSLVVIFFLKRNFLGPDNLSEATDLSHIVLTAMAGGA
jgi:hypothetical protein